MQNLQRQITKYDIDGPQILNKSYCFTEEVNTNLNKVDYSINPSLLFPFPVFAFLILAVILGTLVLSGCIPPSTNEKSFINPISEHQRDPVNSARLNFFLTLKDDLGPAIRLEIASIEINTNGRWLKLTSNPLLIDSTKIAMDQLFLGGMALPPGNYRHLRFTVTKGEVQKENGQYHVIITEPLNLEVDLNNVLELLPGDSRSVLISWNLENSLRPDNTLVPDLTAAPPLKQMLLNLIFVACPDIDTIFIVRTDKNWVVDSFGVSGRPTHLSIDPGNDQILYILAAQERTIKAVDLSTYRVVNFFPVPLNDQPTFMVISPDGRSVFLLDEYNGYLSRMNLTSGQIEARIQLNFQPKYAVFMPEQNILAVALSLSQKILVLDPENFQVISSISTGGEPQGLHIFDNQILVAEYGDNTVSAIDLANRQTQSRMNVGFGPRRLQNSNDQIYVSNYQEGSLSVLVPGQLGIIQEIYGFGLPLEMVFNQAYSRLYVADEKFGSLGIVNTNSNRLQGHIYFGARPLDLEMIQ